MKDAFARGWEAIFGPKPPVRILRNPFVLRARCLIHYEVPIDFTKADLARLVRHLGTMCEDWEPEDGFAEIEFRRPEAKAATVPGTAEGNNGT